MIGWIVFLSKCKGRVGMEKESQISIAEMLKFVFRRVLTQCPFVAMSMGSLVLIAFS